MTEILREMIREARKRVENTSYEAPKPKPVDEAAKQRGRFVRSLWKQMKQVRKELAKQGYELGMPHAYGSDKVGKVTRSRAESQAHKAAFDAQQQARYARIAELRQQALIHTLGMNRRELRAYMEQLQRQLAKV